jgi:hypothetical protein
MIPRVSYRSLNLLYLGFKVSFVIIPERISPFDKYLTIKEDPVLYAKESEFGFLA